MKISITLIRFCLASAACLCLVGCSEYWWKRGQPPASPALLEKAKLDLSDARTQYGSERDQIARLSEEIEQSLVKAVESAKASNQANALTAELTSTRDAFIEMEGKLSIGSRAAYGELSSQLRAFVSTAKEGEPINQAAFELFSARVLFFLANELSVPAPAFG